MPRTLLLRSLAQLAATAALLTAAPAGAGAMDHAAMGHHDMAAMERGGTASRVVTAPMGGFDVATRSSPVVSRGPEGPLWAATRPRASRDADAAAAAVRAATRTVAARASISTAEATRRLSPRCRRLLKVKRPSRLKKADRKRRAACLEQRRKIVREADQTTDPSKDTSPTTPGVSAPEAPAAGPAPGPVASDPAVPVPNPTTPSGIDPSEVQCSAVGVKAVDIDQVLGFRLTRATACISETGIVNFELTNTDAQPHNLYIRTPGQANSKEVVIDLVDPVGGKEPRKSRDMRLKPGSYELICDIPGHGAMKVQLTILTKADYIAQGYAG